MKILDNQGREEIELRPEISIFSYGIPFNVDQSPYWQYLVRVINTTLQGLKSPKYDILRRILLKKESQFLDDILKPIHSSWGSTRVSIISSGWTNTRHGPLINVIALSPKGLMFIKAKDCSR